MRVKQQQVEDEANKQRQKEVETEVKLKTIVTDGYFGQDGLLRAALPAWKKEKQEPLQQTSRMLELSNKDPMPEAAVEAIRDKNLDRLRLLR